VRAETRRDSRRLTADAICQEETSAPFIARHAPNWNRRTCSDEQGHWRTPSPILPLNLIRLTTLPFLHAIWTGITGYFIGFARLCPDR
jgi:hypothetical protein